MKAGTAIQHVWFAQHLQLLESGKALLLGHSCTGVAKSEQHGRKACLKTLADGFSLKGPKKEIKRVVAVVKETCCGHCGSRGIGSPASRSPWRMY